eukprot:12416204-Alexandrium_andersonii.AAC.1
MDQSTDRSIGRSIDLSFRLIIDQGTAGQPRANPGQPTGGNHLARSHPGQWGTTPSQSWPSG